MNVEKSVFGVLNYEQFEKFYQKLNLKPDEIKANFDGWRKLVLYTNNRVFLFPRDPRGIEWLDVELLAYEILNSYENLPLPKFIRRIKDSEISYYEFAEVSRLRGTPYSKIENSINLDFVEKLQLNLAKLFAIWHEFPREHIPLKIRQRQIYDPQRYEFEIRLLSLDTMEDAFEHLYDQILSVSKENNLKHQIILEESHTKLLWKKSINEIACLDHVLLHGDIHEDQILVDSKENMEITGILDWETTRVDNPIWEFNFGEWGFGIWKWWENFLEIRKKIWSEYLERRDIKLSTAEGLNLVYTLFEFRITLNPKMNLSKLIGKNQQESIKKCLERLVEITKRMKDEIQNDC